MDIIKAAFCVCVLCYLVPSIVADQATDCEDKCSNNACRVICKVCADRCSTTDRSDCFGTCVLVLTYSCRGVKKVKKCAELNYEVVVCEETCPQCSSNSTSVRRSCFCWYEKPCLYTCKIPILGVYEQPGVPESGYWMDWYRAYDKQEGINGTEECIHNYPPSIYLKYLEEQHTYPNFNCYTSRYKHLMVKSCPVV